MKFSTVILFGVFISSWKTANAEDESPASKSLIGSLLADPAPEKQVSNTISKQTIAQNDTTTTMRPSPTAPSSFPSTPKDVISTTPAPKEPKRTWSTSSAIIAVVLVLSLLPTGYAAFKFFQRKDELDYLRIRQEEQQQREQEEQQEEDQQQEKPPTEEV